MENEKIVQRIEIKADTKEAVRSIHELENELKKALDGSDYTTSMTKLSEEFAKVTNNDGIKEGFDSQFLNNYASAIFNVRENLKETKKNTEEIPKNIEKTNNELNKTVKSSFNFSSNIKQAFRGLKRTILSLVGVQSIWSAIRRGMSTYLAQNDEWKNKLQACYYAIGSLFAPAFEFLVNVFVKIIYYLNQFLKGLGLAGINMTNLNNKANKAKKTLAGFDEITNVGDNSDNKIADPFADASQFNTAIAETLYNIGEKLRKVFDDLAEALKKVKKWWDELPFETKALVIVGLIAVFIVLVVLITKLASKTQVLSKALADLTKMAGIAVIMAAFALVVESIASLIDSFANSGLSLWQVLGLIGIVLLTVVGLLATVALLGPKLTAGLVPFGIAILEISAILIILALTLPVIADAISSLSQALDTLLTDVLLTIKTVIVDIVEAIGTNLPIIIEAIGNLVINVGATIVKTITGIIKAITDGITNLGKSIENFVDSVLKSITKIINFIVSAVEWLVNTLIIDTLNALLNNWILQEISDILDLGIPKGGIKHIGISRFVPKYETGTNYVPEDQLAYIHKGEAIVPKEFNPSAFYGANTAEELNLLAAINDNLERLNAKETSINLDGINVAQTINNKIQELKYRNGERVFAVAR